MSSESGTPSDLPESSKNDTSLPGKIKLNSTNPTVNDKSSPNSSKELVTSPPVNIETLNNGTSSPLFKNLVEELIAKINHIQSEESKVQSESDIKNNTNLIDKIKNLQVEGFKNQSDIVNKNISQIFKTIQAEGLKSISENITKISKEIGIIRTGGKEITFSPEEQIPSIYSLNNKIEKFPISTSNFFVFVLPHVILFFILVIIISLIFIKSPSMNSVNTRIDNLSTSITENSPNSQIQKLKGDTTDIKNGLVELNKKGVAEIKDLIAKIGSPMTLSNDILALKTSVDNLLKNPFSKKDLDEIKTTLKTLSENKSTTSPPQFIGQPTESSKFAKELLGELLKAKGFTDEIAKSSNLATKEALKLVDDKLKLISDSIKTNPKTDKIEDSLKSIDENIKSLKDSINKSSKTDKATEDKFIKIASDLETLNKSLQKKPKHRFLLICSTSLNFNPVKLDKLGPLFKDISETIATSYSGIDWKMGIERAGNYNQWFDNKGNNNTVVETKLKFTSYVGATPDFTTNFLTIDILKNELNNDIFSDIIIVVPPDVKPTALKNLEGTPIFMNGSRVHVIFLSFLANGTITQTMVDWSKLCGANGGGAFSIFYFKEPILNENDFSNKLKDHVLRLVQKFN